MPWIKALSSVSKVECLFIRGVEIYRCGWSSSLSFILSFVLIILFYLVPSSWYHVTGVWHWLLGFYDAIGCFVRSFVHALCNTTWNLMPSTMRWPCVSHQSRHWRTIRLPWRTMSWFANNGITCILKIDIQDLRIRGPIKSSSLPMV